MKVWKSAVVWFPLVAAACGDVETVPTQTPKSVVAQIALKDSTANRSINIESQGPPDSVPAAYQHQPTMLVKSDVGFNGQQAYAQSTVSYFATNVTAKIDLAVRNSTGFLIGSNTGQAAKSHIFPTSSSLTVSTTVDILATCGATAQATAWGEVYDSFITSGQSVLSWGRTSDTDTKSKAQAACPPAIPPVVCSTPSLRSTTLRGLSLDCTTPGGGDGSTPPSTSTPPPEPPIYTPPYYPPKTGQWNCILLYGGTDYERWYCWWVENDDTRIATGGTTRSSFAGAWDSPSFTSGEKLPSVFVIVSDAVPAGSMAVVERHKEGKYKNVLLVPSQNFRPAELVRAMRYMFAALAATGETPKKDLSAQLKGSVADAEVSASERDYAATFTTMLSKSKSGDAGPYGARPFLEIQLGPAKK